MLRGAGVLWGGTQSKGEAEGQVGSALPSQPEEEEAAPVGESSRGAAQQRCSEYPAGG